MLEDMITNMSGGAFELKTGRPWTHGISPYREAEALKLEWRGNKDRCGGRWYFQIDGVQYSAWKISPRIERIQRHGY